MPHDLFLESFFQSSDDKYSSILVAISVPAGKFQDLYFTSHYWKLTSSYLAYNIFRLHVAIFIPAARTIDQVWFSGNPLEEGEDVLPESLKFMEATPEPEI